MAVERIATGMRWAEGRVYFPSGRYVLFSDIPNNRIMRYCEDDGHLSVFRQPSMNSNGNTIKDALSPVSMVTGASQDRARRPDHCHRG